MSALGKKQTFRSAIAMSALLPKRSCAGGNPLTSSRCWLILAKRRRDVKFDLLAVHAERAHPMVANFRVNCVCGAIYDVIEARGPTKDQRPSKRVLCDRELFRPEKLLVKRGSSGAPIRIESDA